MRQRVVLAWPYKAGTTPDAYTSQLYRRIAGFGWYVVEFSPRSSIAYRGAIVHVHWPEAFLNHSRGSIAAFVRSAITIGLLAALRRFLGDKLVWTTHNVRSHENRFPVVEEWYWRSFCRLGRPPIGQRMRGDLGRVPQR